MPKARVKSFQSAGTTAAADILLTTHRGGESLPLPFLLSLSSAPAAFWPGMGRI
ncbi:MAG: hypothetical protein SOX72_08600 [Oscillospiraceae bacterium]|nr:hypothetical protein [Oscillospiraceae bacterium]